jgi:hypothetical protein
MNYEHIFLAMIIALVVALLVSAGMTQAQSGGLNVDLYGANGQPLNAYNLVVDSNVESPSTYGPSVATVIARFCNESGATMDNVWGYIGDFTNDTPGIYPSVDTDTETRFDGTALDNTGSYAFTHLGGSIGTADASRFIGTLEPGECKFQYWHFIYPQCTEADRMPVCSADPVWGDSVKPEDDLSLSFDVWGEANGGSYEDNASWTMTMRNEISAMANKIEPNPNGEWYNTNTSTIYPGDVITSNGVLYRFGNANKGFDNDGDGDFDYNAWAQPIGDVSYDPSCFRLIGTTGVLTVSRSSGKPDMIINFADQLYFTDLPPDNTDLIGRVHYVFQALNGPCASAMTPYQEVASGADNEKFNGDFGAGIPPLASHAPEVEIDKSGNVTVTPGSLITYAIKLDNKGEASAGLPLNSMPLMIDDTIPDDTTFSGDVDAPGYTILYSVDGGVTFTTTQPSDPATVTDVQLWMDDTLAAGASSAVTFTVNASSAPSSPVIENCADVSFGQAEPFDQACTTTLVEGTNTIGDYVWQDENADGLQNGESGIANVTVELYWDKNGDGAWDDADVLLKTTETGSSGDYLFDQLPSGDYIVVVNEDDTDLPYGYSNTTPVVHAVSGLTGEYVDADFGFGPVLVLEKILRSGSPVKESDLVTYDISLRNTRPGVGSSGYCEYTVWAGKYNTIETQSPPWQTPVNAVGSPDGTYATLDLGTNTDGLQLGSFHLLTPTGNIQTMTLQIYWTELGEFLGDGDNQDDLLYLSMYDTGLDTTTAITTYYATHFDQTAPATYVTSEDLTSQRLWQWSDLSNDQVEILLEGNKGNVNTSVAEIGVDAVALVITTDQTECGGSDTIATLPLSDTYNADKLQFVSAEPPVDATSTSNSPYANTGILTWSNLGPLYAGQSKEVTVVFKALEPTGANEVVTNTATVTGAQYLGGKPVHDAEDDAPVEIIATGTIGDVVWHDQAPLGTQDVGEPGIPYVVVELWQDGGDGDMDFGSGGGADDVLTRTTMTDLKGAYLFEGLTDGTYWVRVDTTTLPGASFTLTYDPDNTDGVDHAAGTTLNNSDSDPTNDDDLDLDFGYQVPNAIFGNVWHDVNGDASQVTGEEGISGVTVYLCTSTPCTDANDIDSTTTDADGNYLFTDQNDGTYYIGIANAAAPLGSGWSNTVDPEGDPGNHQSDPIPVSGGGIYGSYDFGYHQTGTLTIGDTLYYDWDGDGAEDPNEEGIPNVTIKLYEDEDGDGVVDPEDAVISTTTTSSTGAYLFENLPNGDYLVVVDEGDTDFPSSVTPTGDPDESGVCTTCDEQSPVTLSGSSVDTVDFGYQPYGSGTIGDTVWRDMNGDGAQSGPQETGIPNVTVDLYADLNGDGAYVLVTTTTTDADGAYLFENLPDGAYRVDVDTTDADLPDDAFGNNYVPTTSTQVGTTITNGDTYLDVDFGFAPLGAIGDTIYWDVNENGVQDWTEAGIDGIDVTLTNTSAITVIENGTPTVYGPGLYVTTTTTVDGAYLFTELPYGTYTVTVGYGSMVLTGDPDTNGMPCTEITDPNDPLYPYCDSETSVELNPGSIFLGADFGYRPVGAIGDTLWLDANQDGVYDPDNEMGLGGITVTLKDNSGTPIMTTTTDVDGHYYFADLEDGDYTVVVDTTNLPSGLILTYDPHGGTANESDVTISGGNIDLDQDFGYGYGGAYSISGTIFWDATGNGGNFGANGTITDTAFSDITVYLWKEEGGLYKLVAITQTVAVTATTNDGPANYIFNNLPSGNYKVSFANGDLKLKGMTITSDPDSDSDNDTLIEITEADVSNVDFGLYNDIDFGDLDAQVYPTLLANEGAGHIINDLYLGTSAPDGEGDGQSSPDATGDADDDADGIAFTPGEYWIAGSSFHITATVTGDDGYLVGYFDWNFDGDFADSGEVVIFGDVSDGINPLEIPIPIDVPGASTDPVYLNMRFRLYDKTQIQYLAPTGLATNGEVEDYQKAFNGTTAVQLASLGAQSYSLVTLALIAVALILHPVLERRIKRRRD